MKNRFTALLAMGSLTVGAMLSVPLQGQTVPLPINGKLLEDTKRAYLEADEETDRLVGEIADFAERKYLDAKPIVVTDKKRLAPSNDPRDYVTLSPYWWPDSTKADGLPYVRHDGKRNPEVYDYPNREQGNAIGECVELMSVLYHITGDRRYARVCAQQLRAWFTDAKTGINPNMMFSQVVPGSIGLRGTGIIDSRRFVKAILLSQLIEDSGEWTATDRAQLQAWAAAYCYWLENSTQGRKEANAANNHGLWYDTVRIMLLAYLGRRAELELAVRDGLMAKLETQIAEDGSLPQELQRTLSLHYSTFVMEALIIAANVVQSFDIDLWQETTDSGKGLQSIVNYLAPYYIRPEKWPHEQIKEFSNLRGAIVLYEGAMHTDRNDWLRMSKNIEIGKISKNIDALIYRTLK